MDNENEALPFPKLTTLEACQARYGEILGGKWAGESTWCSLLVIPPEIGASWINTASGKPVNHIYCNKDMQAPLLAALTNLQVRGFLGELKTFDGCFMIRDVRGLPGKPSCHSYGLAIDMNAATNKLGETPTLSEGFVECFTDAGFDWGGDFHRMDGMHMSYAWEHTEPRVGSTDSSSAPQTV